MTKARQPALLIVDLQDDFCPGGALAVADGDKIVKPINRAIRFFDKNGAPIFASRDWHPPDTKHFKDYGGIWPAHCVADTRGAKFHPDLKITGPTYIVTKGTSKNDDGYSPFEGTAYGRPLDELLRAFKVTDLFVCGLATDYCVKAACLDARKLGYTVYLMTDTCRAVNVNNLNDPRRKEPKIVDIILRLMAANEPVTDENIALEEMRRAGVIFTTTDEVLR